MARYFTSPPRGKELESRLLEDFKQVLGREKMLKAQELRQESDEELGTKLEQLRREIFQLRSQKLDGKGQKTHLIGEKRKDIARILTVKKEKKRNQ